MRAQNSRSGLPQWSLPQSSTASLSLAHVDPGMRMLPLPW